MPIYDPTGYPKKVEQTVDLTETTRRKEVARINADPSEKKALEALHGDVWNTAELQRDFDVLSFVASFVVVIRKGDKVKGTLKFQHSPRFYFNFTPGLT